MSGGGEAVKIAHWYSIAPVLCLCNRAWSCQLRVPQIGATEDRILD